MDHTAKGQPRVFMTRQLHDFQNFAGCVTNRTLGAYTRLEAAHWSIGSLPKDLKKLAIIAQENPRIFTKEIWPEMHNLFTVEGEKLIHPVWAEERDRAIANIAQRSAAGRASGRARSNKRERPLSDRSAGVASADATELQQSLNVASTPTPTPMIQNATHSGTDVPQDARSRLWREGLMTLRSLTGKSDAQTRAFLGRLLRDLRDDCAAALTIIDECADLRTGQPEAWLVAAAKSRVNHAEGPPARTHQQTEFDANHARLAELLGRSDPYNSTGPIIEGMPE